MTVHFTLAELTPSTGALDLSSADSVVDLDKLIRLDIIRSLNAVSLPSLRVEEGRALFKKMTWRFTTRKSDDAVCLAILLGLDVSRIRRLAKDSDTRMKAFIQMQKCFPTSMLFDTPSGGTFEEEEFRWAPRTFLGRNPGGESVLAIKDQQDYKRHPTSPEHGFADDCGLDITTFGLEVNLRSGFRLWSKNTSRLDILSKSDIFAYAISIVNGTVS